MSQNDQILRHLKSGKTIDPMQALKKFSCMRLAARIYDLSCRGHIIYGYVVRKGDVSYKRYYLAKKDK